MNVKTYDQNQRLMFPPHLSEFLPDDHQSVIISDIVDTMDLGCFYSKISSEGSQAYHPKMMFKILAYAYTTGIFSSRKIHKALQESVAFIFLAAWQKPDFRTISDFRKNNLSEFATLFNQLVDMCNRLGMTSLGHFAIDGSKFKANAADSATYNKKRISDAISNLLQKADQIDCQEDQLYGTDHTGDQIPADIRQKKSRLQKLKQIKTQMDQSHKEKINATDPDAAFMKTTYGIKTSYNAQIIVDEAQQLIVAANVTNDPSDTGQLVPMVQQAEKAVGRIDKLSADSGYSSGDNLCAMVAKGIDAHIPDANYQAIQRGKQDAPGQGLFTRSDFNRDELNDCFICPAGEKLHFVCLQKVKDKHPVRIYRCQACGNCLLKKRCTNGRSGRNIALNVHDAQFKAMRTKLDSPHGKRIYAKRKWMVEPVFGHIKETIGFRQFSLRGLHKVIGEFFLVCMAHNMRKIINVFKNTVLQGAI
jgi:transposase